MDREEPAAAVRAAPDLAGDAGLDRANAIAERVIGTVRRECLDPLIPLGEGHLRRILRDDVAFDNANRPHRALDLESPAGPRPLPPAPGDRIVADPVLGGLHHVYRRVA